MFLGNLTLFPAMVIMDGHPIFWVRRHPPWLKYWMPIHYDTSHTIEDGQNKKSHLLFSFLVRIVLFLHLIGGIYLSKIVSFHWFHLNNYTPYENKCFNPRNQIHRVAFVTRGKFHLRTDASRDIWCSRALNTQLPRVKVERAIHHVIVMDGRSFGQSQWNFLLTS